MNDYITESKKGLLYLAAKPKILFLGQGICYPGHMLSESFEQISAQLKIELPVFEDTQLGMAIGLSLAGYVPVAIYPRYNFLLLAMNQLVNHLDHFKQMSDGEFNPKVIIKTVVGSATPLHPGIQHIGNYSEPLHLIFKNIVIDEVNETRQILPAYRRAWQRSESTLLVEFGENYAKR